MRVITLSLNSPTEDLNSAIRMQPNDLNLLFSRAIFFKACESFLPAVHAFSEIIDLLLHSDQEVEGRDTYSEENLLSGESRSPACCLYRFYSYQYANFYHVVVR